MKRVIKCIGIFLILSMLLANAYANEINLYVEDVKLELDNKPVIINGNTLVPVRAIFENLGAKVEWNGVTKTVTGKTLDKTVILVIDNKTATVNGSSVELAVPARIINGSTYVPARFVAESLGAEVNWDNNTKSVLVNSDYPYGKYKVTRVVDGDTIEVDFNGTKEKVRLIGIDTPESVHPDKDKNVEEGKLVSDYTKEKLEGKEIALEFDVQERDHYGRLLAYVWVDGVMYNKQLLIVGYAQISTYPPNVRYVDDFTQIQKEARESKIGLWNEIVEVKEQVTTPKENVIPTKATYIGNANTKKYHYSTCSSVNDMKESNKVALESREDAIRGGYVPCKRCNP
jgi:endonuclease YncB( thermonuclease family)